MTVTVVVGNPKPRSRTRHAAELVTERLTSGPPDVVIELAELSAELTAWSSDAVADAKNIVVSSELLVVASPTYKGTYTGVLKSFLDRFGSDELFGVTAVCSDAGR